MCIFCWLPEQSDVFFMLRACVLARTLPVRLREWVWAGSLSPSRCSCNYMLVFGALVGAWRDFLCRGRWPKFHARENRLYGFCDTYPP